MQPGLTRLDRADALPESWDQLATSLTQRRAFLAHTERHNPCAQRYYLLERGGRVVAGACVYSLRLDLLTFLHLPSPVRLHFVGVPCSVSAPGVIGAAADVTALLAEVFRVERGIVVGLNLDGPPALEALALGKTLPAVVLDLGFPSFAAYRGALRSAYRRRLDRVLAAWDGVRSERGPCARMDAAMHQQYLDVFARSQAKLERLSLPFFQGLPPEFHLTTHHRGDRLLGWHISVTEGDTRAFFLAGIDYAARDESRSYMNVLAAVVRESIEDGMRAVDLGQTAEIPKLRLGGRLVEKTMFGWSSSALVRWALVKGRRLLEYRAELPDTHVFRAQVEGRT